MSNPYIAEEFIESVKLRGFLPNGTGMNTSQILRWASEEAKTYITAFLKALREEYLVTSLDLVMTSNVVSLPVRAVGGAFRSVEYLQDANTVVPLVRIEPERRGAYNLSNGLPYGYIFKGNTIEVVPSQTGGLTLRLSFQQRLSSLVLSTDCGEILSIDGPNQITCSSVPATFTNALRYDLVSGEPNFTTRGIDLAVSSVNTTTGVVIFSNTLPTGLAVGDWLAKANQTPIIQVPTECHVLLASRVAEKIGESTGSTNLPAIRVGLAEARADATVMMTNRTTASARPVINRYGIGWRRFRSMF
jgi:hypothetical protein